MERLGVVWSEFPGDGKNFNLILAFRTIGRSKQYRPRLSLHSSPIYRVIGFEARK